MHGSVRRLTGGVRTPRALPEPRDPSRSAPGGRLPCPARARLPRLRLPVPLHGGRRRALVPQPRASGSQPTGTTVTYLTLRQWAERRASRRSRGCEVWRWARGSTLYTDRDGGASHRRWCSGSGCCGTCCATAAATTWSTPPRFPTSPCWPRRARRAGGGGFRLVVDWHEVWSADYWREYLGPLGGRVGCAVQRLLRAGAPAGVLLLGACTPCGCARRGCAASPTVLRGE